MGGRDGEAVVVPLIFVVCVARARADARRALDPDFALDEQDRVAATSSPEAAGRAPDARSAPPEGTVRAWWEEREGPWGGR